MGGAPSYLRGIGVLSALLITNYTSIMISDILISSTLAWFLARRKTRFTKTGDGLSRVLVFLLQTNLISLVSVTTLLIIFLSTLGGGESPVGLALFIFLPKLHSNSLLYSLNMRAWYIASMTEVINARPRVTRARADHSSSIHDIEFAVIAYPGVATPTSPNDPVEKMGRCDIPSQEVTEIDEDVGMANRVPSMSMDALLHLPGESSEQR